MEIKFLKIFFFNVILWEESLMFGGEKSQAIGINGIFL